jgi:hypothetical protein
VNEVTSTFRVRFLRARRALAGSVRRFWERVKQKGSSAGLHDWLMVVFTFILTIVAIEQGILAWQNSQSSTEQMGKIITAADQLKNAAASFSESASQSTRGSATLWANFNCKRIRLRDPLRPPKMRSEPLKHK